MRLSPPGFDVKIESATVHQGVFQLFDVERTPGLLGGKVFPVLPLTSINFARWRLKIITFKLYSVSSNS